MRLKAAVLAVLGLLVLGRTQRGGAATEPARRPNIIFILTDDLGYGDVGGFGQQKIRTPNLDRLAAEGMRLTQHYAGNAVCAPSRCVLLTGKHPGHACIRDNHEIGPWASYQGQLPMPASEVTVARLLQNAGYATGAFGKWGLGGVGSSGDPLRQGFDTFFGYNCQRQAHNYYPQYLVKDAGRLELANPPIAIPSVLPKGLDVHAPTNYAAFSGKQYAPDLIAEQARRFLRANKERPFFLYFPTTVPHLALQVPEDSLAEYLGQWPDEPYPGGRGYLPHRAPRAAYAAMITRLDREIGRMMALVKELGLEAQTVFIFTSDNGPLYEQLGGTDCEFFASAGGLRGRKGSLYEGGIRTPLIVRWKGRIAPGTVADRVTGFEDWLPTLLELAGAAAATPKNIDGLSFAPTLLGQTQPPRPFLYRESPGYGGQQSVRVGDWVGVRQGLRPTKTNANPPIRTELYNLARDLRQTNDVSALQPEVVTKLERRLREEHIPSKQFPFPPLDNAAPK
jgi:arylsulfatase A-like enzyme